MIYTGTYKKVLTMIILLLVGLISEAQQHTVVVGSVRTFRVPATANHVYQWEVLDDGNNTLLINGASGVYSVGGLGSEKVGGIDPSNDNYKAFDNINFTWSKKGDYTLRMTEANASGCTNVSFIKVKVVDNLINCSITSSEEYDTAQTFTGIDARIISVPIKFLMTDSNDDWQKDYFKRHDGTDPLFDCFVVSLKYAYYVEGGIVEYKTMEMKLSNSQLALYKCKEDFSAHFGKDFLETEDINEDRYFEFEIVGVRDKYGGEVNVDINNNKFTFGIYKKTSITKINHK